MVITVSVPLSERAATPAARRITSAGHSFAVLAQPDGKHAGHRERRCDHAGELVGAALRAERLERDLDLADGLRIEERIGDDGRRRVLILAADNGHDQHRRVLFAFGQ